MWVTETAEIKPEAQGKGDYCVRAQQQFHFLLIWDYNSLWAKHHTNCALSAEN